LTDLLKKMKKNKQFQMINISKFFLISTAILFVITYIIVVFFRIQYPFELEWMEGSMVDHVMRIIDGKAIYLKPSIEFVPSIYTPFYFYLSAFMSKFTGIGFFPLRFVSFLSSLGCFALIFSLVKKETKNIFLGFISASLFFAMFRISGAWFDIARCDSLFLFLLLLSVYILRFKNSWIWYITAGLSVSLAFLTKQTTLVIIIPVIIYLIFTKRQKSLFFIGTALFVIMTSILILNGITNGWFTYFVLDLTGSQQIHRINPTLSRLSSFWLKDILATVPVICCIVVPFVFYKLKNFKTNDLFYIVLTIGMVGGTWYSRINTSSYNNVLFPAYAIISILFGLSINYLIEIFQNLKTAPRKYLMTLIYFLCILQFIMLIYNPLAQIPTQKDIVAGNKFIKEIGLIKGEILAMGQGFLPVLAGKKTYAHRQAIYDIYSSGEDSGVSEKLKMELKVAIKEQKFQAIIINSVGNFHMDEVNKYYKKHKKIFIEKDIFYPVTGLKLSPRWIYVPKQFEDKKVKNNLQE